MQHAFIHSFPAGAQVALPLNRQMHLYALMQELALLAFVIDQATHHWEAMMFTKGYGPISALQTILKAHDRRVKLLGLLDGVPAAEIAAATPGPEATATPPSPPPAPAEPTPPTSAEPVPTVEGKPNEVPVKPHLPTSGGGPVPEPKQPPTPLQPPRLLPLDSSPPPTDGPNRQRDFRQPTQEKPPLEWDFLVT